MTPRDLTTGEAEAWRAGWRAAVEAAARELLARRSGHGTVLDSILTNVAAAIGAMEPPA